MPTRPDLRDIASNVRDALGDCDRETLVDLLTFVLKEYVVEGPPPMLVHQTETIADLHGLSFAQLIAALQTRLDLPELALFAVDGERVSVRVGGVVQPLVASRSAPDATELPRPAAGVRIVEAQLPRPAPEAAPAPAPRPTQGVSLRGAPLGGGGGAPASTPPAMTSPGPAPAPSGAPAPAPAGPPAPAQAASPPAKEGPAGDGDDAAARFSLLELD